jgi:hypothetical protein
LFSQQFHFKCCQHRAPPSDSNILPDKIISFLHESYLDKSLCGGNTFTRFGSLSRVFCFSTSVLNIRLNSPALVSRQRTRTDTLLKNSTMWRRCQMRLSQLGKVSKIKCGVHFTKRPRTDKKATDGQKGRPRTDKKATDGQKGHGRTKSGAHFRHGRTKGPRTDEMWCAIPTRTDKMDTRTNKTLSHFQELRLLLLCALDSL